MAVITTATFLPFFPGGYDPLSKPLSGMAWVCGRAGLLLVPLGGLWLWFSHRNGPSIGQQRWLARATLGICSLIALVVVLVAFAGGPLLAAGTGTLAGLLISRLARRLRAATPLGRTVPSMLAVVPILVLAVQSAFIQPIALRARNRVIANSAPLISEIERYRARQGGYPASLFSLYGDYKPAVVGVQRYHYEPSGDAYNLIFEEPSPAFGLRRFVVYNPRDQQRLTVHETDRLLLDDAGLDADNAGYTLVQPLPQPHWKLFTFRS